MTIAVPDHTGNASSVNESWFTTRRAVAPPAERKNLAVVGSVWGPQILPDHLVTITPTAVGYERLWSDLDPAGMPARAMAPGTYFPPVTGALKMG